jgi:hypothetical protein
MMTLDDPPQPGVRRYVIATISQPTTKQSETHRAQRKHKQRRQRYRIPQQSLDLSPCIRFFLHVWTPGGDGQLDLCFGENDEVRDLSHGRVRIGRQSSRYRHSEHHTAGMIRQPCAQTADASTYLE